MAKAQPPGVKHWAVRIAGLSSSVLHIAGDWMAQRGEMHADLVGAPGIEVTAQECMPAPSLDHLITSAGEPPPADHRHPLALPRIPSDGAF